MTTTVGGTISGYCATGSVEDRQRADDDDHDRQHRGEDRAVDEEVGNFMAAPRSLMRGRLSDASSRVSKHARNGRRYRRGRSGSRWHGARCGVTLLPGDLRRRPLTITQSSGPMPSTTLRPSNSGPVFTGWYFTRSSAPAPERISAPDPTGSPAPRRAIRRTAAARDPQRTNRPGVKPHPRC